MHTIHIKPLQGDRSYPAIIMKFGELLRQLDSNQRSTGYEAVEMTTSPWRDGIILQQAFLQADCISQDDLPH